MSAEFAAFAPPPHAAEDPTVVGIESIVFRLPMDGELRWGQHSALREVQHVLVVVTLSDGSRGVAEAPPRPTIYGETVFSIRSIIQHELTPRLVGQSTTAALTRLHEIRNNHTAKGALDMAIHHARAAGRGQTLAAYLGATQSTLRVSYILGIAELDNALREAETVYNQGVRVLKVKVGRDWTADLARVRTLQRALPADLALYADANECFHADDAAARLAELADLGVLYCEEPLPVEEITVRAALMRHAAIPIIADDSCFSARDLVRELALDTFHILNIKTARTGYTESARMLERALAAGKGIMVGSQASAGLGTARAGLFAARPGIDHPSELSFFLKLKEDILATPLQIVDGRLSTAALDAAEVDWDLLRDVTVAAADL